MEPDPTLQILNALHFAADKHRDQRRKDFESSPYINHVIEVAQTLARVGNVREIPVLQAALLHDTVEDTETTLDEIEIQFGPDVRGLVEELTDDRGLPRSERRRLQVERAPSASPRAKALKIADKICNVRDVVHRPPAQWSLQRRREYLDWTERVVNGCSGVNSDLEAHYRRIVAEGRRVLDALEEID